MRALRTAEKKAIQAQEHEGMLTQWTATTVRLASMDIVVAVVYLAPNIGIQGTNWTTLLELSDYLHVQGLPFIVAGDFNAEIGELEPTCMDRFLGADWAAQPDLSLKAIGPSTWPWSVVDSGAS